VHLFDWQRNITMLEKDGAPPIEYVE
jgi:hypothetical protein